MSLACEDSRRAGRAARGHVDDWHRSQKYKYPRVKISYAMAGSLAATEIKGSIDWGTIPSDPGRLFVSCEINVAQVSMKEG